MDTSLATLDKRCTFDLGHAVTCGAPTHCRGYCEKHYAQLRRAGAFTSVTRKPASDKPTVLANIAKIRKARRKLVKSAPEIVDAFIDGMKNQARTGKTDAAQWAILHTHILEPVTTNAPTTAANGVTVNIGVKVSGTQTE